MELEYPFLWEALKDEDVLLYGIGDGADKIFARCEEYGINVVGVFVTDSFYREKTYKGFKILKRSEALQNFSDAVILLCFGLFEPADLEDIKQLSKERTVYAPDVPVLGEGLVTYQSLKSKREDIEKAYSLLYSDADREIFKNLLEYKLSGNITPLISAETSRANDLKSLFSLKRPYTFADLGAYRGDTIEETISLFGEPKKVYALEPAPVNFRKMQEAYGDKENYILIQSAAYKENREVPFSDKSGRGAKIGGKRTVKAITVDCLALEELDYLKIDVEGAEADALTGAKETINRTKPFISLSAYHRMWDMVDLILYINKAHPFYKIHLRHHPYIPAWDVMLYLTI